MRSEGLALAGALVLLSLGAPGCEEKASIQITSPSHGAFVNEDSIVVTGTTTADPALHTVKVNGAQTILGPNGSWSATVSLDRDAIFNNGLVTLEDATGETARSSIAVLVGGSVLDGDLSPEAIAVRVNESAFDSLGIAVEDIIDLDLGDVLPVGHVLINDCFVRGLFGICIGSARVSIINPPPTYDTFDIAFDSQAQQVAASIDLTGIRAGVFIDGSGVVPNCTMNVWGAQATVDTQLALHPHAVDATKIDVEQTSNATIVLDDLQHQFTGGLCTAPIIGQIIQAFAPDIQQTAEEGTRNSLNTTDGAGNTPIAHAAEIALAGLDITGPLGSSLAADVVAPFFEIAEDEGGLTFGSDVSLTAACSPPTGAPDLVASYSSPSAFPAFGPTTPDGGVEYDAGFCISTAGFNQLLRAQTECGLFQASVTSLDLGGGPLPLTAGVVSALLPSFGGLPPALPLRIDLQPTLAPVFTGNPGPNGEMAEVRIGYLLVRILADDGSELVFLEAAAGTTLGVDVDFDEADNALRFVVVPPATPEISAVVTSNLVGASETQLTAILPAVFSLLLPSLQDSLQAFPVPSFTDFQLDVVELARSGEFLSIFGTLSGAAASN